MFVSHIIDAFGGKSSSCWTPDDPFIQKKRPILTPFQRENRKIQGVGQKRKVQQTLEFTGLFWRRVRDSNPRFLLGTRHFECRTFDLSDNSPCLFSSGFLSRNLFKNSLERKQERRQKIFDFEIFCVEEYQGESGGRKSQVPPKFRVSPVMTTSIPPHSSVSYHKFFQCATPESIILPSAACNRGEGAVVWTDVC